MAGLFSCKISNKDNNHNNNHNHKYYENIFNDLHHKLVKNKLFINNSHKYSNNI